MTQQNCTVTFTGRIVEGMDPDEVFENIATLYKTDVERIKKVFSGQGAVIKKDVDRQAALKMQKTLLNAGVICDIEPREPAGDMSPIATPAPEPMPVPAAEKPVNPYAAPKSDVRPASKAQDGFAGPRKRPASHGARWIFQAISLFLKRPFTWILTMFVYVLVSIVVMLIPVLGALIQSLLNPVYQAGFMMGGHDLNENGNLSVGSLFQGFKNNFGQLLLLGLLFLGSIIVIAGVSVFVMMTAFGFDLTTFQSDIAAGQSISSMVYFTLVIMGLIMPVVMCYWFSPALIAINQKSVFEAIALSFKGALKNILGYIVYVIVFIGVMMGVGMVLGLLGFAFGRTGTVGIIIPVVFYFLVMISVVPVMMLTMYTSYKDVFYDD